MTTIPSSDYPPTGPTAGDYDANAVIQQTLAQYGLQSLSGWAWNEIVNGASTNQVTVDMYNQPAFQQRFPGIFQRQAAGLPPISPADYVSYEDQAKQLENMYGMPSGFLTDPTRIGNLIGGDVSMNELTARVQQGYNVVANAPIQVRQSFADMFGAYGDGALAAHFLDTTTAAPLLEFQATAADIAGQAANTGVNVSTDDAMKLAELGQTASSTQSGMQSLSEERGLFNQRVGDQNPLDINSTGVEAEFGLNATAGQQVETQKEALAATASGGGGAEVDQYGTSIGAARPF